MTKVEALEILSGRAWSMWKPAEQGTWTDGVWHRETVFAGVQVLCTHDEWSEIIVALHDGGD